MPYQENNQLRDSGMKQRLHFTNLCVNVMKLLDTWSYALTLETPSLTDIKYMSIVKCRKLPQDTFYNL